jgi:hypothetical protein
LEAHWRQAFAGDDDGDGEGDTGREDGGDGDVDGLTEDEGDTEGEGDGEGDGSTGGGTWAEGRLAVGDGLAAADVTATTGAAGVAAGLLNDGRGAG